MCVRRVTSAAMERARNKIDETAKIGRSSKDRTDHGASLNDFGPSEVLMMLHHSILDPSAITSQKSSGIDISC